MGRGTVLCFFSGKMDQDWAVFWSKTELWDSFLIFLMAVCQRSLVLECDEANVIHYYIIKQYQKTVMTVAMPYDL